MEAVGIWMEFKSRADEITDKKKIGWRKESRTKPGLTNLWNVDRGIGATREGSKGMGVPKTN